MLTGILAMVVGLIAILFAKFVLPKMQEKIEAQNKLVEEKRRQKKEAKEADKND